MIPKFSGQVLPQLLPGHLGVNLGGAEIGVAGHVPDLADIGALPRYFGAPDYSGITVRDWL